MMNLGNRNLEEIRKHSHGAAWVKPIDTRTRAMMDLINILRMREMNVGLCSFGVKRYRNGARYLYCT